MIQIIPAIDLMDGRCVRLEQGAFEKRSSYAESPLDLAKRYTGMGFTRLHLVDLDGARTGAPANLEVLETICARTTLEVDFGGGIRDRHSLDLVIRAGAQQVNIGSLAIQQPATFEEWIGSFGAGRFILAADVKGLTIAASGWTEETDTGLYAFLDYWETRGIREVLCTDIARDGMLQGPSHSLYAELSARYPALRFIASGGVSAATDVEILDRTGVFAVVIGKALLEGRIREDEIKEYIK